MDYTVVPGRLPWIKFLTRCDCMATHVKELHVFVVMDMWHCKAYRSSVHWSGKTPVSYITDFLIFIADTFSYELSSYEITTGFWV